MLTLGTRGEQLVVRLSRPMKSRGQADDEHPVLAVAEKVPRMLAGVCPERRGKDAVGYRAGPGHCKELWGWEAKASGASPLSSLASISSVS